jgi:hypothetical protein
MYAKIPPIKIIIIEMLNKKEVLIKSEIAILQI